MCKKHRIFASYFVFNLVGVLYNVCCIIIRCAMYIVQYTACITHYPYTVQCTVYTMQYTVYTRVYQNLTISSENYKTFPKVGPHYKEKSCKFLACSNYSLRPNSCVSFEIFVSRHKISTAQ